MIPHGAEDIVLAIPHFALETVLVIPHGAQEIVLAIPHYSQDTVLEIHCHFPFYYISYNMFYEYVVFTKIYFHAN